LDSVGDVLISGPAVRAVAAHAARTTVLTSPAGAPAAKLLPGVGEVLAWACPWISADSGRVDAADVQDLVAAVRVRDVDEAVILTSFHQSALPTALLLRLAGVERISGVSEDYPGSLLDVRIPPPADGPEPERMLEICRAAGFDLPVGDDGRLRGQLTGEPPAGIALDEPFVVVHPGANAPARRYPEHLWRGVVAQLTGQGWTVLVTGSAQERALTAAVAAAAEGPGRAVDHGGAFDLAQLASVLARAATVVAANTGPAHLAAAVDTPVVSLFAPVVPLVRWAPYTERRVVLGDQHASCRDSRATSCPLPGHPCLSTVSPEDVVDAIASLAPRRHLTSAGAT